MTGYEDIIHLPHHVSVRHPQMSRQDRAAQFAPFAALTGHKDAIRETERLTERKRRLSEDCRQILDLYLREVCQRQEPREVDFEYFVPDQKKEGGSYQKKSGCIRRIDTYLNEIVLQSGDRMPRLTKCDRINFIISWTNAHKFRKDTENQAGRI